MAKKIATFKMECTKKEEEKNVGGAVFTFDAVTEGNEIQARKVIIFRTTEIKDLKSLVSGKNYVIEIYEA